MRITGARMPVPGATGALGAAPASRLHARGAAAAVAGRAALARGSPACGHTPRHADQADQWVDAIVDALTRGARIVRPGIGASLDVVR
ncbi:hypothetical protein ACFYRN_02855 [Streptomyces sp. NPDC005227]|uniref:hypothetical protein n=1 Tax=Streptomyces sp. NPDC005227 TaxID=3364707 RepID=UPI0036C07767